MVRLIHQRCFNHSLREAAAKCPECARFFCRECVTEHEDRLLCAGCLKRLVKPPFTQRGFFVAVVRTVQLGAAVVALWWFFFFLGQTLARLPSPFHADTTLAVPWWSPE